MIKKTLLIGFGIALFATPFVSLAATVVSGTVIASPAMLPCPTLYRSLSVGARGNDVISLQQFLSAQGYLDVSATGYFGVLTKTAVGKWQTQNGVAVYGSGGYGIFGPLSRSSLLRSCGSTQSQQSFSAVPQSGSVPLTTTFTTSDSVATNATFSVDFDDGQTGTLSKGSCIAITAIVGGQGGIGCSYTVSHTYSSNGTYTAKLIKNLCGNTVGCEAPSQIVGTATITVGAVSSTGTNFTASPKSGAAPLTVQFTSSAPQGSDVGNTVNFGDGTTGTLGFVPVCSSCNAMGIVSHTYASIGTYTATLTGGACSCPAGGICNCPNIPILGTATITVGSTVVTPNIQKLSAPGSISLSPGGIAEIRNESSYFTLEGLSTYSATIQITPVGCWNSFPSDTPPQMRCMIAVMPIPPQSLSVGQTYTSTNYSITLSQIANGTAVFSVAAL